MILCTVLWHVGLYLQAIVAPELRVKGLIAINPFRSAAEARAWSPAIFEAKGSGGAFTLDLGLSLDWESIPKNREK